MSRSSGAEKWSPLCFKIGYSETTWTQSREGTCTLTESCRVFLSDVILKSDWVTKFKRFSCSILVGCRQFFRSGWNRSVFRNILKQGMIIGNVLVEAIGLCIVKDRESGLLTSSALTLFRKKKIFSTAYFLQACPRGFLLQRGLIVTPVEPVVIHSYVKKCNKVLKN